MELKRWDNQEVIFELECSSLLELLKGAFKAKISFYRANLCGANLCGADLRGADLRGANLCDANLRDANLCDADLCGADLRGANLRGANLCDADLRDANLCDADLCGADLRGANLRDANLWNSLGNKKELRTIQVDTYSISFTKEVLQIGCKRFTIEEWKNFKDSEIKLMDSGALEWWKKWKNFILKGIELSYGESK